MSKWNLIIMLNASLSFLQELFTARNIVVGIKMNIELPDINPFLLMLPRFTMVEFSNVLNIPNVFIWLAV
jgi:hypothetical protein